MQLFLVTLAQYLESFILMPVAAERYLYLPMTQDTSSPDQQEVKLQNRFKHKDVFIHLPNTFVP
jgi:hypothetical protein